MVRSACIDKNGLKKGAWSKEEDDRLRAYILKYGHWNWRLLPKYADLARCGKSCRLRWVNYLKPGLKRGNYTKQEEQLIIKLHHQFGNKWSAIATKLPGRTDNEIKNHWHAHLKKRIEKRISAKIETFQQDDEEEQMNISLADRNRNDETSFNEDQILLSKMIKNCEVSSDDNVVDYYSSNSLINHDPDIWDHSDHNAVPEFNVFSPSAETSNSQMDYFGDQNLCETLSSGLKKDDTPISSDSFDGFQSRFWNEPFLVDTYFYDQSDCFSGYLSDFDATVNLFYQNVHNEIL